MTLIKKSGLIKYYVNEKDHNPPHVPVRYKDFCETRITMTGVVLSNNGFKTAQLKIFVAFILKYHVDFLEAWDENQEC
jgi:hypothetical protein